MTSDQIIALLPYQSPFLFVDEITKVSEEGIEGYYKFDANSKFYEGHFKDHPITPGVILTECMAQIGLVCMGIYMFKEEVATGFKPQVALTSTQIDFFIPVNPGEKVKVVSQKDRFRFNKLKCKVALYNEKAELVCRGIISGMIKNE